jgi:hydrogenase/urease accessory protein HupE
MWPYLSLVVLVLSLATPRPAWAHPVAQGAMDVLVRDEGIDIRARVANEEAFVAAAFSAGSSEGGLAEVWRRHGTYLLTHLHVTADDDELPGQVVRLSPPGDGTATARITYELHFPFAPARRRPATISIRQDVLNEFEFAPGNPWEATYVVRVEQPGGAVEEGLLLTRREPLTFVADWQAVPGTASVRHDALGMFVAYLRHGILHILGGYDHLLFMAALVLAVVSLTDLVKVVTAFTLAHTLTLTLAVLDVVRVPERVVEPMIALSIVVVALQNVVWPDRSRGRERLAIAFGFGLFHGLGFAGGLLEAMEGMPGMAVATAIAAFSLGVEIGHQMVVLPIFTARILARRAWQGSNRDHLMELLLRFGSGAISVAGMLYFVAALR